MELDFPSEARGRICLNASGLSEDQRAIVTAKTQGDFKIETAVAAVRSCFPDFTATAKQLRPKPVTACLAQDEADFGEDEMALTEIQNAVVFEYLEAFLVDHGVADHENQSTEVFDELEATEILATTWKEKRSEISRLQKARLLSQVGTVKKQFNKTSALSKAVRSVSNVIRWGTGAKIAQIAPIVPPSPKVVSQFPVPQWLKMVPTCHLR